MADSTIGGLPLAPQIDADSLLAVEQQGQARHMTGAQFAQFARDSVAGFTDTAKEYAQQAAASAGTASAAAERAETAAATVGSAAKRAEEAAAAAQAAKESVDASEANVSALEASAQEAKTEAAASAVSAAASAGSASADAQKTAADRTAAESAKAAAETAQAAAETAADTATGAAESAAESAETAIQYSGKPPKPQDGTWWVWNADAQEYRDTGIKSVLSIVKSYPSVGDMEADLANMQEGDLVIIASSVGDEDNSKLFVHGGAAWVFLSDLSGLEGVGIASWERTSGDGSPGTADGYTLTLTDGRTFTYSVYNGRDGVGAGDVLGVPFSLELPAGGWADGDLTASSPLLLAAGRYSYLVGPAPASRDEYTECVIWAERLTEDGKLLFHSEFDPESTLSVQVLRFETPDAGGAGTARVFNAGSGGGGGGGMKLAGVSIVKPPDKLVYKSGESFDPSGMVVNAAYTNGAALEITGYTYSPQVLTDGVTAVTVSYAEGRTVKTAAQPVTVTPVLAGLEVRVQPAKTAYRYLETFDPAGMEADAVYSDGARRAVTGYTYPAAAFAVLGAQEVTLSYSEDGRTVTASVPVTVSAVPLPVPTQAGALTYTGSAQSPVWNGYDSAKMTLSGETSGTDAGAYHAQFALAYGYEWPDGSAEPVRVPWTIGRAVIAQLPAVSGTLTFDGTEQSPTFIGYDPDKMTLGGDTAATEPGDYAATFTPTANYQWADGSTGAKSVAWTIANVVVTIPHQVGALTYNGAEQSPAWEGFDAENSTISGDTSATDAGEYTAVFTLKLGVWEDGTKNPKAVPWSIARAVIPAVPAQNGTLTYTGNPQSPTLSGYDPAKMTLGGTTTATDAGAYTASVTPTANYCWADGSTGAKTVTWRIAGVTVAVPTQSGALDYKGNWPGGSPSTQSPSWNGFDEEKMTIGGTTSAVNAGTYYAVFTLKPNYQWPDGTTAAHNVPWTIGKAAGLLLYLPTSISLTSAQPTKIISFAAPVYKAVVSSSNPDVATCSEFAWDANDAFSATVTGKANGTATITVTVPESDNYLAVSKTVEVTVSFGQVAKLEPTAGVTYTNGISSLTDEKLNEYARAISDNVSINNETSVVYIDDESNHYKISVGDSVNIAINYTSYAFVIIGFNHDDLESATAYGSATATGKAGITLQMKDCLSTTYKMNPTNTNYDGWGICAVRNVLKANIKNQLPANLQSIIKTVTKKASIGSKSSTINSYSDTLFLLAEVEIFGGNNYSVSGEGNQYAWYKAGNDRIKNINGSISAWCLRSPVSSNTSSFCIVNIFGNANYYEATRSCGVAFGFCI